MPSVRNIAVYSGYNTVSDKTAPERMRGSVDNPEEEEERMNGYKVVAAVFLSTVACGDDVTEPEPLYPATVAVSPETGETKTFADTIHLTATVRDQNGDIMDSVSVEWSTGDTLVATVSAKGIVTAWRRDGRRRQRLQAEPR